MAGTRGRGRRATQPDRRAAGAGAEDGRATRERIVDAAQHLFAAKGYDAASVASVAAEAGVPSGLVFYYFSTKRELLRAVVRERAYRGSLRRAVTGSGPRGSEAGPQGTEGAREEVEKVLRRAAAELAGVFRRHRDTQQILFREAHTDPELAERAAGLVASSTGDLAALLGGLPQVRADEQERLAVAQLLVTSLLMDNFLRPTGTDPARSDPAVRLLATALVAPPLTADPPDSGKQTPSQRPTEGPGQ